MTSRAIRSCIHQRRLRFALATAFSVTALTGTEAFAQTANTQTGNSGGASSQSADITAGEAGRTLTSQNVFSSTADGTSAIGGNAGRFTSSRLADQPTAVGNANATQQNAFNQARNLQRLNQQFNRASQNRNPGSTQGRRAIRPSLRLGFVPAPRPTEELRESLSRQIQALRVKVPRLADGRSEFASVKFDFGSRGEVILTGNVPNTDAGNLLVNILRMEPGVTSVENQMNITPPAPAR